MAVIDDLITLGLIVMCVAVIWWASDSKRVARLAASRRGMGLPGQERTMRISAIVGPAIFILFFIWTLIP